MKRFFIDLAACPAELADGLRTVATLVPLSFTDRNLPPVIFETGGEGVAVRADAGGIRISYAEKNDAFRGLGLLNARPDGEWQSLAVRQKRRLRKMWVMVDASRNAVLNRRSVAEWLVFLGLAGINGFMFYTEDTYLVPGEPLFGYMRGAYSEAELREFDATAFSLGIEMIPCLQTLAHMQRVLRYDAYEPVKDAGAVMLCGEERTYVLIEKMIRAASRPFRSRRIHIGLDEAWDLGRGKYLDRHGQVPGFEIITKHLERVLGLVRSAGLKPMMWGDMYFRVLSSTHDYFDPSISIDEEIRRRIPPDVDLIYWDYYHQDGQIYDRMFAKYDEMGRIPIFAPGIWSWNRFWAAYDYAESTMFTGLKSCLRHGGQEAIVTMWGDDGTECDLFSTLPLLQLAADLVFTGELCHDTTRENLRGTLGVAYDDWALGQEIDQPPFSSRDQIGNISKSLLWEDPLHGLYQPQLEGHRLNAFYRGLAGRLEEVIDRPGNARLRLPFLLAEVLSIKADLPSEVLHAYRNEDRSGLEKIRAEGVPLLMEKIRRLNRHHRELWHANYKPFGWEVIERRYGGLLGACENLAFRLGAYLSGEEKSLAELEETRVKMYPAEDGGSLVLCHWQVVSTGEINHT